VAGAAGVARAAKGALADRQVCTYYDNDGELVPRETMHRPSVVKAPEAEPERGA